MKDAIITVTERIRRITDIDLEPILQRLVYAQPVTWTRERAESAVHEYSRFLMLAVKYPGERLVPTADTDAVWHEHIMDTLKYSRDCEFALGRFLHHCPAEVGTSATLASEFRRTSELYEREFGESYLGSPSEASCNCTSCHNGPVLSGPAQEIRGQSAEL